MEDGISANYKICYLFSIDYFNTGKEKEDKTEWKREKEKKEKKKTGAVSYIPSGSGERKQCLGKREA